MAFAQAPGPGTYFTNLQSTTGVTGRPQGRTTRAKPVFFRHPNAPNIPEFMRQAKDLMNTYGNSELPPGIQPRWMLNKKNVNISKGMTKAT